MENYDVIGCLGEGSFGRVYKAKSKILLEFVALKVISKRGRSLKEIKGLRRECQIQKHLHHPNIIQMLDSFETENEIVVITEFAHKELNVILWKEGYLPEEKVQTIVWDLVSALYYLHSHRVLHRDLKPQNILLDASNKAKLCDFGFARNMSTGTHVLTSIKGTPLYMAPELIEEQPYDHNADLWSLGCIIYELLVGAPPFCAASILHLIRVIRHEQVQWPTFISEDCISFLKGLLQKDPTKRLTWPEILNHPFVNGHILVCEDSTSMPLTRPLSANTLQVKEQQRKEHFIHKTSANQNKPVQNKSSEAEKSNETNKSNNSKTSKQTQNPGNDLNYEGAKSDEIKKSKQSNNEKLEKMSTHSRDHENMIPQEQKIFAEENDTNLINQSADTKSVKSDNKDVVIYLHNQEDDALTNCTESEDNSMKIYIHEESHLIENEEWVVFLHRTIEEVINGEFTSLVQQNLLNIVVSPLRNCNTNPKVLQNVANLLSLPFVIEGITNDTMEQIQKVYLEVKLIPNLVYSSKLLAKEKQITMSNCSIPSTQSSDDSSIFSEEKDSYKSVKDLSNEDIQALEHIYLLICHLVHLGMQFLNQFCDAVVVFNMYEMLQKLLHVDCKNKKIVADIMAILNQILRKSQENSELLDRILLTRNTETSVNFIDMLMSSDVLLRERTCILLTLLLRHCKNIIDIVWSESIKETLEALVYDSALNVRNAAEACIDEMRIQEF